MNNVIICFEIILNSRFPTMNGVFCQSVISKASPLMCNLYISAYQLKFAIVLLCQENNITCENTLVKKIQLAVILLWIIM